MSEIQHDQIPTTCWFECVGGVWVWGGYGPPPAGETERVKAALSGGQYAKVELSKSAGWAYEVTLRGKKANVRWLK